MITSRYQLWALPWVGFVNKSNFEKCRCKKGQAMSRFPAPRNSLGVSSAQSQKGQKRGELGNLSLEEPPGLFVLRLDKFWKNGRSEKRLRRWALGSDVRPSPWGSGLMLGLMEQELKWGNNARQQRSGKNGFCQANLIYF